MQLGGFNSIYYDILTEICLRNCVESGKLVHHFNSGTIACKGLLNNDKSKLRQNSILAYNYFRSYYKYFKAITGLDYPKDINYQPVEYDTDHFAKHNFDIKLYGLFGSARGKRVAVVGPNASIDVINRNWLKDFDILIGLDYMAEIINCDYCITDKADVASYVINNYNYNHSQMLLPYMLEDKTTGRYSSSERYDSLKFSKSNSHLSIFPPFIDGNIESVAIHFAMFMLPESVTIFGVDRQITGDISHTTQTTFYNDGKIWNNSEATKNLLKQRESELKILRSIGDARGIKILRVDYV
jgi:hypothetical protein